MHLKTVLFLTLLCVLGVIMSSYFVGGVLTTRVVAPFSTLTDEGRVPGAEPEVIDPRGLRPSAAVKFVDADLQTGWIPWVIRQLSILIGGLSLIVFLYAGISLIIYGDNEEQLGKSMKMIVFGIVGIVLAAFSYSIVGNLLNIF